MKHAVIRFHGAYRYATKVALEEAIALARAHVAEEELEDEAWVRYFVSSGAVLTVNVDVPDSAEYRFVAANVFLILAHGAIDGTVEARRGQATIDVFASGTDD
jgi:hypothetical protein